VRAAQGKWVTVEFEGKKGYRGHVISYDEYRLEGEKGYRGHVISYDEKEDSHTVRWLDVDGAAERRCRIFTSGREEL
jgi:hypothetical protein